MDDVILSTQAARKELMLEAARVGDHQAVERLIPLCDEECLSTALRYAAFGKQMSCIKLLCTVADAKHNNSAALRWSVYQMDEHATDFLIPLSDCHAVLNHYQKEIDATSFLNAFMFLQERMAVYENLYISQQLHQTSTVCRTKKI